MSIEQKGDYRE